MNAALALIATFMVFGVGFLAGFRVGFKQGVDEEEAAHDFDRCPHCGEYLDDEDDDEEEDA